VIVKVQRPLFPPDGEWLIYDQRRSFKILMSPTQELLAMMGSDLKAYFQADPPKGRRSGGMATIKLMRRVDDQPW
jgi:hypothetical protein